MSLLHLSVACVASAALVFAHPSAAQAWPDKPVRVIVPYAAGGPTDVLARSLGRKLGERLGVQFVIDNRPGGGTVIGTQAVVGASADGYTLLMGATPLGINPGLLAKVPYDATRDLEPIAFVAGAPVILVAHPGVAARSLAEVITAARGKPGVFNVASPGNGSMGHLSLALMNRAASIELQHVPYKGAGQALTDLLGGQVQLMFDNVGTARPNLVAGKTRAIAVASLRRTPALPDVPTFDEAGLKGFETGSWFALFAPARTPPEIIARLNTATGEAIRSPEMRELYERDGYEAEIMSPGELGAYLRRQIDKWSRVVREAGIKSD